MAQIQPAEVALLDWNVHLLESTESYIENFLAELLVIIPEDGCD
ncbi:MAG: hypothetical protein QNK33_10010 [Bacteroidales bacterium]|nr:hypothetical protein [Bacteroidales bacterium]